MLLLLFLLLLFLFLLLFLLLLLWVTLVADFVGVGCVCIDSLTRSLSGHLSPLTLHLFFCSIAKITLPEGWWDKRGIGGDMTARGPVWQRGNKLGDRVIESPIKQCPAGICGSYTFSMMVTKTTTVADFRESADAYKERQLGKEVRFLFCFVFVLFLLFLMLLNV